jgi:hypothetical protein
MDTTDWLITATFVGPVLGAIAATSLIGSVLRLARARAQRVEHVPASGTDLYHNGVPMTETQFREAFAAMQSELDELPVEGRSEAEMQRQYAAVNRLSMLAGTYPHAFPMLGNADSGWQWYAANNRYAGRRASLT